MDSRLLASGTTPWDECAPRLPWGGPAGTSPTTPADRALPPWLAGPLAAQETAAQLVRGLLAVPPERAGMAMVGLIRIADRQVLRQVTALLGLADRARLVEAVGVVAPELLETAWEPELPVEIPDAVGRADLVAPAPWRAAAVGREAGARHLARARIIRWQFAQAEQAGTGLRGGRLECWA